MSGIATCGFSVWGGWIQRAMVSGVFGRIPGEIHAPPHIIERGTDRAVRAGDPWDRMARTASVLVQQQSAPVRIAAGRDIRPSLSICRERRAERKSRDNRGLSRGVTQPRALALEDAIPCKRVGCC